MRVIRKKSGTRILRYKYKLKNVMHLHYLLPLRIAIFTVGLPCRSKQ